MLERRRPVSDLLRHSLERLGELMPPEIHEVATCTQFPQVKRLLEAANFNGVGGGTILYMAHFPRLHPSDFRRFQPAEVVILAANGAGTPRLLLNSASSRFPNGLANSSGLVGKNLMPQVSGYVDEEMDGDRAPPTVLWSMCG